MEARGARRLWAEPRPVIVQEVEKLERPKGAPPGGYARATPASVGSADIVIPPARVAPPPISTWDPSAFKRDRPVLPVIEDIARDPAAFWICVLERVRYSIVCVEGPKAALATLPVRVVSVTVVYIVDMEDGAVTAGATIRRVVPLPSMDVPP
jgi:hypothetical protein